jgi:hypothetical protein
MPQIWLRFSCLPGMGGGQFGIVSDLPAELCHARSAWIEKFSLENIPTMCFRHLNNADLPSRLPGEPGVAGRGGVVHFTMHLLMS